MKKLLKSLLKRINKILGASNLKIIKCSDIGIVYGEISLKSVIEFLKIDMVFDVGANAGQYAFALRNNVNFGGSILSFEPIPDLYIKIKHLSANDNNWKIQEYAIDESSGKKTFNIMAESQFSSFLNPQKDFAGKFDGGNRVLQTIDVNVTTLSEAIENMPFPKTFKSGLLKLDTQGTEYRILKASKDSLNNFKAIQCEVSFKKIYEDSADFEDILNFMNSIGFELACLFPNNYGHFPNLLEMDTIFIRKELIPIIK